MCLANGYGMVFLFSGGCAALGLLLVALALEWPLLARLWRRPSRQVLRWVIAANLASGFVAVFPIVAFGTARAPGLHADPWQVYAHGWVRHLAHIGVLFALTVVVEGIVYRYRSQRQRANLKWKRIAAGTLVANVLSYALLAAFVLVPWRHTGDFVLLPTTDWLAGDQRRVWFVDAETSQLCSINLDGTDRRTELNEPLGRFDAVLEAISCYALIPDDDTLLHLGRDERWHAAKTGTDRVLNSGVPESCRGRWTIVRSLCAALGELGRTCPAELDLEPIDGVYYSGPAWDPWTARDELGELAVYATTYWGDGSGSGVQIRGPRALHFGIRAGVARLACRNPVIVDERIVLFECGNAIAVMDIAARNVGLLARGDSVVMRIPSFQKVYLGWEPKPEP